MIEIKDILKPLYSLLDKENLKKDIVLNVLSNNLGIQLKNEDLRLKNGSVFLNIKPIYKNKLLLKKDSILRDLEDLGFKNQDRTFL